MNTSLLGKRACVCGSTRGIGRAIAEELADLGANITLVARNQNALEALHRELASKPGQIHNFIVADFTSPPTLKEKITSYLSNHPPFHILINNTGGPPPGDAITASEEDFILAFSQHLICNQILVQALCEGMKKEGFGRIINILSTSVKEPIPGLGVSNTIRGAVAQWSKTLARELGPYGITVNNVLPGYTRTERLEELFLYKAKKSGKSESAIKEEIIHQVPLRRLAEPHEIAQAVAFLASPAASYVNGINFPVDGGRTGCL